MKQVLLFTHYLSGGGAEKTVRRLASYINSHSEECGYHAYVCVVYDDHEYHSELVSGAGSGDGAADLIVMKHKSAPGDPKLKRAFNVIRQIRELREIKRRYSIDICVSFLPGADWINVWSGAGERRILSVRNRESLFVHGGFRRWYIHTTYSRCDRIVAVTEVVRRDCIRFFGADPDRVVTVYNAVESVTEAPADMPDGSDVAEVRADIVEFMSGCRVIINVGRLTEQKSQNDLIRAYASLASEYPDTVLLILGEGELRDSLQTLIDEQSLSARVMLAGYVHDASVYMREAEMFVLSSRIEGMPNVLLEALSCGLPCISTECGAREILAPDTDIEAATDTVDEGRYGLLVPVGDTSVLEKAMRRLLDDHQLAGRYRSSAAECVSAYTPDMIYKSWIDVLDHLPL